MPFSIKQLINRKPATRLFGADNPDGPVGADTDICCFAGKPLPGAPAENLHAVRFARARHQLVRKSESLRLAQVVIERVGPGNVFVVRINGDHEMIGHGLFRESTSV